MLDTAAAQCTHPISLHSLIFKHLVKLLLLRFFGSYHITVSLCLEWSMKDIGILQELQLALTSNRMSAKVPLSKVKEYLIYSDVSFHFVSILAKIVNKVGSSAQNPLNLRYGFVLTNNVSGSVL